MAGTEAAGTEVAGGRWPPRVSMQEHMAIDLNPGPIRPIHLISDYFPHFHPFAEPALRAPDPHPAAPPAARSAPQPPADPQPLGDSDGSTALGTPEFTLLFDADNSALHCRAHRAKVRLGAERGLGHSLTMSLLPAGTQATGLRLPGHLRPSQPAARGQQAGWGRARCGSAGAGLEGGTQLPRLHPPGRRAQDPAAVCVCEDPRPRGSCGCRCRSWSPAAPGAPAWAWRSRGRPRGRRAWTRPGACPCMSAGVPASAHGTLPQEELDAGMAAGLPADRILGYVFPASPGSFGSTRASVAKGKHVTCPGARPEQAPPLPSFWREAGPGHPFQGTRPMSCETEP